MTRPRAAGVALVAALVGLAQAQAQAQARAAEPDYRDDRSTPEAVIASLYNAVERREYARAYSYFRDEPGRPDFAAFANGYRDTAHVAVRAGPATNEGAAGSIYYRLPVAVRATDASGAVAVFAGCYTLRLVQPAAQAEPPFRPMGVVDGRLQRTSEPFERAMGTCAAGAP